LLISIFTDNYIYPHFELINTIIIVIIMSFMRLQIKFKRRRGVVEVDVVEKSVVVLDCTIIENCSRYYGKCVPYCELIVAAKDYAFKRRKPKAEVVEIESADQTN